jgi:major membrane immunogen (membrane-anchored lipoprotein)
MLRYDSAAAARAGVLALTVLLGACGKKDNTATVDSGSRAESTVPVQVTELEVGRAIGADKRLTEETETFRPTDVIYAVVETKGSDPNAALQARWTFEDGQVVDESTQNISAAGQDVTEFHISKPGGWPKGKYKVEVLLNGRPVESEEFAVK